MSVPAKAARALALAVAACFALLGGVAGADSKPPVNWSLHVTLSADGGHIIGNPDAPLKLVEYMSYTCPHCAHFEHEGVPPLRLGPVSQGKVSFEIRHLLRDGTDVTVALLTNCVPPQHFMALHDYFLLHQAEWMARGEHLSPAQIARAENGDRDSRMRAIAGDMGFYTIMANHGVNRVAADHCLADQAMIQRLIGQTQEADTLGIPGTPGFVLNDAVLTGVYDWAGLSQALSAKL